MAKQSPVGHTGGDSYSARIRAELSRSEDGDTDWTSQIKLQGAAVAAPGATGGATVGDVIKHKRAPTRLPSMDEGDGVVS